MSIVHGRHGRAWTTAATLLLVGAFAGPARAVPFDYGIDFDKLGVQANFACGGKGACGAVSTVNSFVFLEKQYKARYDNKLTPNYDAKTNTDMKDAKDFGFDGWKVDDNPARLGNYARPGEVREQVYLDTKMDWINDHAPKTTMFGSWFVGSKNHDRLPGIMDLAGEMKAKEDVEFWVKGEGFYHVLLLTEVKCDKDSNCEIRYQDPNQPKVNQAFTKVAAMDGKLQFTDVPGSGFKGTVTITAAFSESPIPEPTAIAVLALGLAALARARRRSA